LGRTGYQPQDRQGARPHRAADAGDLPALLVRANNGSPARRVALQIGLPHNGKMLYMIRHGETEWNAAGRYQGQKDSPLTKRGREQAEIFGHLLAQQVPHRSALRAYVSPLGRTRETAALIDRHVRLEIIDEPRLLEVTIGSWDGLSTYEIDVEFPGRLTGTTAFDWFFRSPDGEDFDAALHRVSLWLKDAVTPAVAISHGLTGRLVRGAYLGLSRREMLELSVPQDGIFRLAEGRVEFISSIT
jgi:broad specificity phosphatase PhoE